MTKTNKRCRVFDRIDWLVGFFVYKRRVKSLRTKTGTIKSIAELYEFAKEMTEWLNQYDEGGESSPPLPEDFEYIARELRHLLSKSNEQDQRRR